MIQLTVNNTDNLIFSSTECINDMKKEFTSLAFFIVLLLITSCFLRCRNVQRRKADNTGNVNLTI